MDNITHESSLYVFGSNHYGQLGVGQTGIAIDLGDGDANINSFYKSLVPVKLPLLGKIRLIHTHFFTNVSRSIYYKIILFTIFICFFFF